jgi:hypothetical protein
VYASAFGLVGELGAGLDHQLNCDCSRLVWAGWAVVLDQTQRFVVGALVRKLR